MKKQGKQVIEIWWPRYHDFMVLVAVDKVRVGVNYLTFTKDARRKGILYSFDGDRVLTECTVTSNGKIKCFEVPLSWLEEIEDRKMNDRVREATLDTAQEVMEEMRL